ncbi:MAG TPA: metallophosphoesterase family protein [Gemmatales bacterium]|nr:metallophosphoesterase family protein [Gemmatales bacterium]
MRSWAIGDIHGCLTAMETLLAALDLQPEDQLIFLGDLVDRGPDTRGVIERIMKLRTERTVHVIKGNHEEMMLIARDLPGYAKAWLKFGGKEALWSYGWKQGIVPGWTEAIPESHWNLLKNDMVDAVEEVGHIMVHGGLDPALPLTEQRWDEMRWKRWDDSPAHVSGNIMVCGHTHQTAGKPISVGHAICIDTWAFGRGWLTALDLASHAYVQANKKGEIKRDQL